MRGVFKEKLYFQIISLLFFLFFFLIRPIWNMFGDRQRWEWNIDAQDAPIAVWLHSEEHRVSCMVIYDVSVFISSHSNGRSQNPSGVFVPYITLVIIWGKTHLIVLNCNRNKAFVTLGEQLKGNFPNAIVIYNKSVCGPLNPLFHRPSQVQKYGRRAVQLLSVCSPPIRHF